MTKKKAGRKHGSKTKGYYFRKGRGWYALSAGRSVQLLGTTGLPLKDARLADRTVREAYARWLVDQQQARQAAGDAIIEDKTVTVLQVCHAYLANVKATGAAGTYVARADTLFDFCFGIPPEGRTTRDDVDRQAETRHASQANPRRLWRNLVERPQATAYRSMA